MKYEILADNLNKSSGNLEQQIRLHTSVYILYTIESLVCLLHVQPFSKSKTLVQFVQAGGSDDTFEKTVKTQATKEAANQVEDAGEQKSDTPDDLGQGFCRAQEVREEKKRQVEVEHARLTASKSGPRSLFAFGYESILSLAHSRVPPTSWTIWYKLFSGHFKTEQ
jgi:hypothetical protein